MEWAVGSSSVTALPQCSNNYCRGKAISITHPDRVFVALVFQHAERMDCITLSYMACPVLPGVSKLSHKWHDFRKGY